MKDGERASSCCDVRCAGDWRLTKVWLIMNKAREVWRTNQVERLGQYSVSQLRTLHGYARDVSLKQSLAIMIISPLPCLGFIMLLELRHLDPPYLGYLNDAAFILRGHATSFVLTFCLLQQFCTQVGPVLPLSIARLLVLATVVNAGNSAILVCLILAIGFPLPFTFQAAGPGELALLTLGLWFSWRHIARGNTQAWIRIRNAVKFYLCQLALIIIYPLYYYIFSLIPQDNVLLQLVVCCLLPLFNKISRVSFHHSSRKTEAGHELIPLIIVFQADIMGTLFVTFCVQNSPSLLTSSGMALFKVIKTVVTFKDLRAAGRELKHLQSQLLGRKTYIPTSGALRAVSSRLRRSTVVMPHNMVQIFPSLKTQLKVGPRMILNSNLNHTSRAKQWTIHSKRLATWTATTDDNCVELDAEKKTSSKEIHLLNFKLHLFYRAELVLLSKYINIMVPALYSLYLAVMVQLPNRVYYPQFANMDSASLYSTFMVFLVYMGLELMSLVFLSLQMRNLLGISPIKQLAFVLHRHAVHAQSAMIMWVVFSTQISLVHYGTDYSFQFEWLSNSTQNK